MNLPAELISQFVKNTRTEKKSKGETTVYGTIVFEDGIPYLRIDGSELLTPVATIKTDKDGSVLPTPVTTPTSAKNGERVIAMIKNHTVIITGNLSSPSARLIDIDLSNADTVEALTALAGGINTLDTNVKTLDKELDDYKKSNEQAINEARNRADNAATNEMWKHAAAIGELNGNTTGVTIALDLASNYIMYITTLNTSTGEVYGHGIRYISMNKYGGNPLILPVGQSQNTGWTDTPTNNGVLLKCDAAVYTVKYSMFKVYGL